jgi:hypothetical protein
VQPFIDGERRSRKLGAAELPYHGAKHRQREIQAVEESVYLVHVVRGLQGIEEDPDRRGEGALVYCCLLNRAQLCTRKRLTRELTNVIIQYKDLSLCFLVGLGRH